MRIPKIIFGGILLGLTVFGITPSPPSPQFSQPPITTAVNDFRLTLTTATCITNPDVTGASAVTIFWTQCTGAKVALSDPFGNLEVCSSVEKQIAVPATTATMYDVWVYDTTFGACTPALELLAWTNDTTRATAISRVGTGFYTKSADLTRRYVGTFRTTAVSGQTEDSRTVRYLYNHYNRDRRDLQRVETNNSWNYNTATIRQANASTLNQVDVVVGVAEVTMTLNLLVQVKNNAGSVVQVAAGIGENSTTTFCTGCAISGTTNTANVTLPLVVHLSKKPALGRTIYSWNEWSQATATTTWVARDASSATLAGALTGLSGWIEG